MVGEGINGGGCGFGKGMSPANQPAKKKSSGALIYPGARPYQQTSLLHMMSLNHMRKAERRITGRLCAAVRSDRLFAISPVNYGWNFAPGSGVT
jgi:hypothetical protein